MHVPDDVATPAARTAASCWLSVDAITTSHVEGRAINPVVRPYLPAIKHWTVGKEKR